jgi:glycosyltransferase involved in cell wall biosynthesis
MPVYNQPDFLNQAIESITKQTFTDYELIIVDDCSGEEVTRQYQLPKGTRLICVPEHFGGDAKGRNIGVQEAKGKYISFLDNDDIWLPDKLETQVRLLEQNPEATLAYCHYIVTDSALKPLDKQRVSEAPSRDIVRQMIHGCFCPYTSTLTIRRDALVEAGPFPETRQAGAVWEMWIRLSLSQHFVCDPTPRVLYRTHPSQISQTFRQAEWRVQVLTNAWELMKRKSPKHINCVRSRLSWACRKMAKIKMAAYEPIPEIKSFLLQAVTVWPWNGKSYFLLAWLPFHSILLRLHRKRQ